MKVEQHIQAMTHSPNHVLLERFTLRRAHVHTNERTSPGTSFGNFIESNIGYNNQVPLTDGICDSELVTIQQLHWPYLKVVSGRPHKE